MTTPITQVELAEHTVKIIRAKVEHLRYSGAPITISPDNLEALANEYTSAVAFRQSVAAALREALAAIAAIPSSDYSTDGDAEELIRRDLAMAAIVKAMKKLNIPITDTHTCPPSP